MKKTMFVLCLIAAGTGVFASGSLRVVASIIPLYNITAAIAGDRAGLVCMVPPGASPHTFNPKPSQIKSLADAELFIQAGAGFEFWAPKLIKASGNKKLKVLSVTDGIKLEEEAGHEEEQGHHAESGNPHVWLDPVLVKDFSVKICAALSELRPADRKYFEGNLKKFGAQLDALDIYFKKETSKFYVKEIVSFHPAWVYFEKRYGLTEVGVIQATPGREATPKELKNIILQIKKYGIKTIFAEPQLPRKAADVIAKEAGVNVLIIDPNGEADGDYIGFMKKNFDVMKEAMK